MTNETMDDARSALDRAFGIMKREATGGARYGESLFRLRCAPDLLGAGIYPNYKEWTEAAAAFGAAQRWLMQLHPAAERGIRVLAAGDGCTPRAGAMFALRTAWDCISVDPRMRGNGTWRLASGARIDRLTCVASTVEDLRLAPVEAAVVIAGHSHADLAASVRAANARTVAVVAIPCCTPLVLPDEPDREYADFGVTSPERTVRVWNWSLSSMLAREAA